MTQRDQNDAHPIRDGGDGLTEISDERLRELLDTLIHCVRYSDRNPQDGYAKDEVMIARRVVIDEFSRRADSAAGGAQWIDVRERLPADWREVPVICHGSFELLHMASIAHGHWMFTRQPAQVRDVTHWFDLPAPQKESPPDQPNKPTDQAREGR